MGSARGEVAGQEVASARGLDADVHDLRCGISQTKPEGENDLVRRVGPSDSDFQHDVGRVVVACAPTGPLR